MSASWSKEIEVITLFVESAPVSKKFYVEVYGMPIAYEDEDCAIIDFGNIMVN